MENTSDSFMPGYLLFCMKSKKSVCYSVADNTNGEYSVTLTSVTGVTGDAHLFSITNIDKEAPVIDYAAIESANGYRKEIPVNEGEEYTEEKLVEMFTKPE